MRWPLVVALVAVTALVASAGTVGAERLITGADIKDGSLTGRDIKWGSLKAEHLESKSQHNVYRSRRPKVGTRSVSQVLVAEAQPTNVLAVTVPAGEYVIQGNATAVIGSASTSITCYFTDTAKQLNSDSYQAEYLNVLEGGAAIPMSIIGAATYTSQTTVYLTCVASNQAVALEAPALIVEQVNLVN